MLLCSNFNNDMLNNDEIKYSKYRYNLFEFLRDFYKEF